MTSESNLIENLIKIYDAYDAESVEGGITLSQIYNVISNSPRIDISAISDQALAVQEVMKRMNMPEDLVEDLTADGTIEKAEFFNLMGLLGQRLFNVQRSYDENIADPTEETHPERYSKIDDLLKNNGFDDPDTDSYQALRQNLVRLDVSSERHAVEYQKFQDRFKPPGNEPVPSAPKNGGGF